MITVSGTRGMTQSSALAIILAAGKGTRMKSDLPKVLHNVAGAPMLAHVLAATKHAAIDRTALVVGPLMEKVADDARKLDPQLTVFVQAKQQGTADAVKAARPVLEEFQGHVLILYGDTPLIQAETLDQGEECARRWRRSSRDRLRVRGSDRIWTAARSSKKGKLVGIREEKDASEEERALTLCNSGIMGFRSGESCSSS